MLAPPRVDRLRELRAAVPTTRSSTRRSTTRRSSASCRCRSSWSLALLIALALNEKLSGVNVYRTIFYLPSQMPVVASALLWLWVFNPDFGLANALLDTVGLPPLRWLFDPTLSKPSIVLITLWGGIGTPLIIFLAGLQGVPDSLYEAASIDGAGALARFRHITLPMLSPIIFFNLIIGIIASFQAYFTLVFVTTQGGPANSTLICILYIYFKAFRDFDMGYAAALAWVLFLIVLALTGDQLRAGPLLGPLRGRRGIMSAVAEPRPMAASRARGRPAPAHARRSDASCTARCTPRSARPGCLST